jgi:hypothetical protein
MVATLNSHLFSSNGDAWGKRIGVPGSGGLLEGGKKVERKLQRAEAEWKIAPRKEDISQSADLLRTSSPIEGDDSRI